MSFFLTFYIIGSNKPQSCKSMPFIDRELLTGFFTAFCQNFDPFLIKFYWQYQKNLCQSVQIRGIWSPEWEQDSHIRPICYPKLSWLKFIWETVKPMGMQIIQNLTRCSGLKSAAPKVPQIRFSFYQNAVVSSISGQRWCKKTCLLIGGVRFLENMHFLCFGR